jgi:hypothetical protein
MEPIENRSTHALVIARRAMSDVSSITSESRLKFRRLSFSDQSKLIGLFAKSQLKQADKLISLHMPPATKPTADYLWFRVLANMYEKPGENLKTGKNNDSLMIKTIKSLYPQLSSVSKDITRLFTGSFRYWVENFYSCDMYGRANLHACLNSPARNLTREDIQKISDESNMSYLGEHIKRYADDLLLKRFPESYKSGY